MADLERLKSLEDSLKLVSLSPGDPSWKPIPALTENTRFLINEWLQTLGVSERKTISMSNEGAVRALRAGRAWVTNNIVNEDLNKRFGNVPKRRKSQDINIDLDDEINGLLDEGSEVPSPFKDQFPEPPNTEQNQDQNQKRNLVIDERAIARAAEAVIVPRLNKATQDLRLQVDSQLSSKLREAVLTLSEDMKSKIVGLASDAGAEVAHAVAEDIINKNLPRRLEIKINNKEIINLDAEPRHEAFPRILKRILRGQHVYMVGGAGTGKTHLFKQVCVGAGYDLETEFFPIDQALTKYDVKGFKSPTGEYIETLVYKCVRDGGLLCIDEADMWAAAALGALNSILANDFGAFPNGILKVHPRFRCIVAANTYGHGATMQYQGRNPLDAASLDRFAYEVVDYDPALEIQIYGNHPWIKYVQKVRGAIAQLRLDHIVSMRASARGLQDIRDGDGADEVCKAQLWRGLDPDTVSRIVNIAGKFELLLPPEQPENRTQDQELELEGVN
jgi:MoxR-like ATPase